MTIEKKDAPPTRSIRLEVEVAGTPEQVWQAIATGPGITAWFVPTDLLERQGGAVVFHLWPGMESKGEVTVWEPPRRLAYEEKDWMPGAPPCATEILVEARSGGTCVVRLVNSLFTSRADWDDQLESFEKGWPGFLHLLRLYLTHFPGQRCSKALVMGHAAGSKDEAWARFASALGLADVAQGRSVATASPGFPAIAGIVERVAEREILLRAERPVPGFAWLGAEDMGAGPQPILNVYGYGDGAPAILARDEPAWRAWMEKHFPSPAASASDDGLSTGPPAL